MSRCLVTGHKGYIGAKLSRKLREAGHEVQGIDLSDHNHNILRDFKEYTDGRFHPHYYNFKPDYVFHLACLPSVQYSVEKPVESLENNVLCTSYLLNFARKVGAKRFVYSSSAAVYGNSSDCEPESPYGLQKLISEMECKLYSKLYNLDTVCLRYFNVYSEDQKPNDAYATVISNWMDYIKKDKIPFINGYGDQSRDFIHVDDVVSANMFMMEHYGPLRGQSYDIGTGESVSLNSIKNIIQRKKPNIEFMHKNERSGDIFYSKADTAPLNELGWSAKITLEEGISRCFLKENEGETHA